MSILLVIFIFSFHLLSPLLRSCNILCFLNSQKKFPYLWEDFDIGRASENPIMISRIRNFLKLSLRRESNVNFILTKLKMIKKIKMIESNVEVSQNKFFKHVFFPFFYFNKSLSSKIRELSLNIFSRG